MEPARTPAPRGEGRVPRRTERVGRGYVQARSDFRVRDTAGYSPRLPRARRLRVAERTVDCAVHRVGSPRRSIAGRTGGRDRQASLRERRRAGHSVPDSGAGRGHQARVFAVLPRPGVAATWSGSRVISRHTFREAMMTQPPDHPERVGEAIAQHLLARAATLDTDGFSLDQLRQAAAEAGISTAAFDAAVAEWRARSRSSSRPTLEKRLTGALLRNAVSFAATWVAMTALISLQRLIVGPAVMPDLIIITSLAAGAIISTRLRARVATILLGGLAVSQGAELLMALASGRPEIHGFGAHMA